MVTRYPDLNIVLTLGKKGSVFINKDFVEEINAISVEAVDTTGAGDTFTGYFLASYIEGQSVKACIELATKASAISVTKKGASNSIPSKEEVELYFEN